MTEEKMQAAQEKAKKQAQQQQELIDGRARMAEERAARNALQRAKKPEIAPAK